MTTGPGFTPLLAAGLDHLPLSGVTSSNNASGAIMSDMMAVVLVALGLAVVLALGIWLKYGRKRNRGSSGSRRSSRRAATTPNRAPAPDEDEEADETEESAAAANGSQPHQHRRKRRPRRNHRPRNPTLAETGGLPPERTGPPHLPLG